VIEACGSASTRRTLLSEQLENAQARLPEIVLFPTPPLRIGNCHYFSSHTSSSLSCEFTILISRQRNAVKLVEFSNCRAKVLDELKARDMLAGKALEEAEPQR
jgi:hypothetical protein